MRIITRNIIVCITIMFVSGCGLDPDFQRRSLQSASNYELCYAATNMGPPQARREAANALLSERGVGCDYALFAQIHAANGMQNAATSAALAQAGAAMIAAGQQRPAIATPIAPVQTRCSRIGNYINCSSY
jgi:hypothetical protein